MTPQERIIRDPAICAGQPIIRGTRVLARVVLEHLARGETVEAILRELPSLTEEDVRAVAGIAATEDLGPAVSLAGAAYAAPPSAASSYDSQGVDRSLIRWMLRLTPRQRLDHLQGMIDLTRSARRIPHADR